MSSSLAAESWTWYGITWLVVIARIASRILLQGSFLKLQSDDAIIIFAMVCDTVLIAGMNIISHTDSNLISPEDAHTLTAASIAERTYGSKWVLVVEQMQCLVIWSVKVCFLLMFNRLTMSLRQNFAVKVVAVYTVVGFVVMEILYLGVWCRPFNQYWAVPPDSILLGSQIPKKKKLILVGVFALGGFTILCAVLNKFYSFTEPFGSDWTFWYIRESSTALIVVNLPLTWTILRRVFNLRSFNGKSSNARTASGALPGTGTGGTRGDGSRLRAVYGTNHSRHQASAIRESDDNLDDILSTASNSQEQINKGFPGAIPLRIYHRQEVEITSHQALPTEGVQLRPLESDFEDMKQGITCTVKGGALARNSVRVRDEETSSEKSTSGIVSPSRGV